MIRHEDWPERLARFIRKTAQEPTTWGTTDCAQRVFSAVKAMTGVDIAEARGTYTTELGAAKAILDFCGGTLEDALAKIAAKHGFTEVPVVLAQRGDIVLFDRDDNPCMGFVSLDGANAIAADAETNIVSFPVKFCRRAWRV